MKTIILTFAFFLITSEAHAQLLVANQKDHTVQLIDLNTKRAVLTVGVDINGHEIIASPDGHFAYVPIYGNSGVGKPGTDGSTIHEIDLLSGRTTSIIDLGKPVRPHCVKFGPDGLLYVSAELAQAIYVIDPAQRKVIAQIPTGAEESHMFVISPDGARAYTANVKGGSVSVLDLKNRSLIKVIPVAEELQRITMSPDGRYVYTHDQKKPRIAVIDTTKNEIEKWISVPASIYSSGTADGNQLIAASGQGQLFVVDLNANRVSHTFDIPPGLGEVLVPVSGVFQASSQVLRVADYAYVSTSKGGLIEVLNLNKMELVEPIRLTPGVDGLAWSPLSMPRN